MFVLTGRVIRGYAYGTKLGFPTANLDYINLKRTDDSTPPGVYAGTAEILESKHIYKAGIVVGPSQDSLLSKVEAHLIGFSGDLYEKTLRLELHVFLRPFEHFDEIEKLKQQIRLDISETEKRITITKNTP